MLKIYSIILLLLAFSQISYSLNDSLLTEWNTKEDYEKSEQVVLKFILWLEQNPFTKDEDDRKVVAAYVLKWFIGCPYVSMSIDNKFILLNTDYKYEPIMLGAYMFGMGYYLLTNKGEKEGANSIHRGIVGMLNLYSSILKAEPDATNTMLDSYQALFNKNELKKYIKNKLEE